jgi:homoserine O-succinyltransferase
MPVVISTALPSFSRLQEEGIAVISPAQAASYGTQGLHIGLLNIMPDAALEATERQFFRLLGASTLDTPLYLHPFTIDGLPRRPETADHIQRYYQTLQHIQAAGLDALIISGANVTHAHLQQEAFWQPLTDVFDWATAHVNSVLCSCLATHALFQHRYGIERTRLPAKRWGVFSHQVLAPTHPLMTNVEPYFDVPHSRFNAIFQNDMLAHGLQVLVASEVTEVDLAEVAEVVGASGKRAQELVGREASVARGDEGHAAGRRVDAHHVRPHGQQHGAVRGHGVPHLGPPVWMQGQQR